MQEAPTPSCPAELRGSRVVRLKRAGREPAFVSERMNVANVVLLFNLQIHGDTGRNSDIVSTNFDLKVHVSQNCQQHFKK